MRVRSFLLLLAIGAPCLAVPLFAQNELYNNGPINGDIDAWTINSGFVVSDTFTLAAHDNQVNELMFGSWLIPGDSLISAEVSITSNEFGGTSFFDQTVDFTQSDCFSNHKGLMTCLETGSFPSVELTGGTYWLNLQNALLNNNGDPVYWDENSGEGCTSPGCPSQASENQVGAIPSESFTILGSAGSGTTPEPGSILLFGSGVVGTAAWIRRSRKTNVRKNASS